VRHLGTNPENNKRVNIQVYINFIFILFAHNPIGGRWIIIAVLDPDNQMPSKFLGGTDLPACGYFYRVWFQFILSCPYSNLAAPFTPDNSKTKLLYVHFRRIYWRNGIDVDPGTENG
jgi:hypothetical protein